MTAAQKRSTRQTVTVEYRVLGELDGVTPAPPIPVEGPNQVRRGTGEDGIIVVDVPGNLGTIDPDLGGVASRGQRCIPWVWLSTGVAGDPGASVAVVDNYANPDLPGSVPVPVLQELKYLTGGTDKFYAEKPVDVPQGSALAVYGYPATVTPKIVRVNIIAASDAEELAEMLAACCCANKECIVVPEGESLDTDTVIAGFAYQGVVLSGSNLVTFDSEGNAVPMCATFVSTDGTETIPVTTTLVEGELGPSTTELQLAFEFPADPEQPGPEEYGLFLFDPFSQDCNNADGNPLIPGITVLPCNCSDASGVGGDTTVTTGTTGHSVGVSGFNFTPPEGGGGCAEGITVQNLSIHLDGDPGTELSITSTLVSSFNITLNFDADGPAGTYTVTGEAVDENCPDPVFEFVAAITVNPA